MDVTVGFKGPMIQMEFSSAPKDTTHSYRTMMTFSNFFQQHFHWKDNENYWNSNTPPQYNNVPGHSPQWIPNQQNDLVNTLLQWQYIYKERAKCMCNYKNVYTHCIQRIYIFTTWNHSLLISTRANILSRRNPQCTPKFEKHQEVQIKFFCTEELQINYPETAQWYKQPWLTQRDKFLSQ